MKKKSFFFSSGDFSHWGPHEEIILHLSFHFVSSVESQVSDEFDVAYETEIYIESGDKMEKTRTYDPKK